MFLKRQLETDLRSWCRHSQLKHNKILLELTEEKPHTLLLGSWGYAVQISYIIECIVYSITFITLKFSISDFFSILLAQLPDCEVMIGLKKDPVNFNPPNPPHRVSFQMLLQIIPQVYIPLLTDLLSCSLWHVRKSSELIWQVMSYCHAKWGKHFFVTDVLCSTYLTQFLRICGILTLSNFSTLCSMTI